MFSSGTEPKRAVNGRIEKQQAADGTLLRESADGGFQNGIWNKEGKIWRKCCYTLEKST